MMSPERAPAHEVALRVGERALARGVTATWWYTFGGILFFDVISLSQWLIWLPARHDGGAELTWRLVVAVIAAIVSLTGATALLAGHRSNVLAVRAGHRRTRRGDVIAVPTALLAGVLFCMAIGSWLAGVSVLAFALSLWSWLHGLRWRVIVGLTALLLAIWIAEAPAWPTTSAGVPIFFVPALLTVLLPVTCASSLWWWHIVLALDRAREAESQLAATRERLRLANDVHDLQGHHLQVIALQLELAQRLMARDPAAAAREITRAMAAVDAARQGTRDLATRFRGVPLPDELDNAADLLRSAGLEVQTRVDAAVHAPADVLGPIVRESVTNVLKHGSGGWAQLSLVRSGDQWLYRIENDDTAADDVDGGSGLDGMTERAHAAGGEVRVERTAQRFSLTVSLPAGKPGKEQT